MAAMIMKAAPIGVIGVGVIGGAMARNLLKAGFKVTVHNRSRAKVQELVDLGAKDGGSPAGVGRASDVVLLCLPDTPDVENVLFGKEGIASAIRRDAVVIDCSTISATATVEYSRRLKEIGVHMLDSPVSGGPKGAQDGTLSCMIGGEATIIERCMPVLQAIGKTFTHVGASGSGQACKSCSALVLTGTLMAISEAFALAKKLGIDPYKVRDALQGGSAQSFVLANHGKRLLDGALQPGFRAGLLLKDIKLAESTGQDTRTFMPVTSLGLQLLTGLCNGGRDSLDSAALGLVFEEMSGIRR